MSLSLFLVLLFVCSTLCKINPKPSGSLKITGGFSDMASNAQYTVYTYDPNEQHSQVFLIDNESFQLIGDPLELGICESFVIALNDSFLVLCRNDSDLVGPLTIYSYTASSSGLKLVRSRTWPYSEVGPSIIPSPTAPIITSEGYLYLLSTGFEIYNQSLLRFNVRTFEMEFLIADLAKASKLDQNFWDFIALPDDSAVILAGDNQNANGFSFYITHISLHEEKPIVIERNTTYIGLLHPSSANGFTIDNVYRSNNPLSIQMWNFDSFKAVESYPLPSNFVYGETVFGSSPSYLFILNAVFSDNVIESTLLQYPTTSDSIIPNELFTMSSNATFFTVGGSNLFTVAPDQGGDNGILLKYQFV